MFNGIIKNIGKIISIKKDNNNCSLILSSKMKFFKDEIGSSISCSGACLTLEKYKNNKLKFYISKETLNKTTFKHAKEGDVINLEKPLVYGDKVSGHYVQGHVDTTSEIQQINIFGKSRLVTFKIKSNLKKYMVKKGSITINGASLTISNILKNHFQVVIIPQTLKFTNLTKLKKNDSVNIELDILAKYSKGFF